MEKIPINEDENNEKPFSEGVEKMLTALDELLGKGNMKKEVAEEIQKLRKELAPDLNGTSNNNAVCEVYNRMVLLNSTEPSGEETPRDVLCREILRNMTADDFLSLGNFVTEQSDQALPEEKDEQGLPVIR